MKIILSIAALYILFLSTLSGATADTTASSSGLRAEGDIGARIFGYHSLLNTNYGCPPGLSYSARTGPATGKWSLGFGHSQTWLDNHVFDGMYYYNGGMNLANVSVTQNNHLVMLDMRFNILKEKRIHPFIDTGLGLTWVKTRIRLDEPNIPDREIAHIDTYPIHSDNAPILSIGIGKRLKLFKIIKDELNSPGISKNFAFLELRAGYSFGGSMTYVNGTADWTEAADVLSTSHSLYDRPIITTSVNAFYIGLTYGVSVDFSDF